MTCVKLLPPLVLSTLLCFESEDQVCDPDLVGSKILILIYSPDADTRKSMNGFKPVTKVLSLTKLAQKMIDRVRYYFSFLI